MTAVTGNFPGDPKKHADGPVTDPNPIAGIYGACNHFDPAQSVSIAEALRMYTYNIAWTSFDEKQRGSLETGKIADMVVLNRNPLQMPPEQSRELKVEKMYVAGNEYRRVKCLARLLLDGISGRKKLV